MRKRSVHYRIGSLEISEVVRQNRDSVHYRIGSLENLAMPGRVI